MERDFTYTRILSRVQVALSQLESAISATPTGPLRNALTDANILLLEAESKIIDFIKTQNK